MTELPSKAGLESTRAEPDLRSEGAPRLLARLIRVPRRRPILCGILALFALAAITPAIILTRTCFVRHAARFPAELSGDVRLERQTEKHTCGMHAIHAVYHAYGLSPIDESVRWRLGVDTKALFWLGSSTGALHPDMYMVLRQDGFDVRSIELGRDASHAELLAHLRGGHALVLLIERRENGALHWVAAFEEAGADRFRVYDSLVPESYLEGADFTEQHILTALAVSPSGEQQTGLRESLDHLSEGTKELARFRARQKQLAK